MSRRPVIANGTKWGILTCQKPIETNVFKTGKQKI
jgi:hypothetical protein